MGIDSIADRLKSERRDVTVQTSISERDSETLDEFVQWCKDHGVDTNRSGAVRAFLCDGLEVFREERAATQKVADTAPRFDPISQARPIKDQPQA